MGLQNNYYFCSSSAAGAGDANLSLLVGGGDGVPVEEDMGEVLLESSFPLPYSTSVLDRLIEKRNN